MEKVVSIPKELSKEGDLVVIPRVQYEEFLHWKKSIKTYKPSAAEKKALKEARRDFAQGKYLRLEGLKR